MGGGDVRKREASESVCVCRLSYPVMEIRAYFKIFIHVFIPCEFTRVCVLRFRTWCTMRNTENSAFQISTKNEQATRINEPKYV